MPASATPAVEHDASPVRLARSCDPLSFIPSSVPSGTTAGVPGGWYRGPELGPTDARDAPGSDRDRGPWPGTTRRRTIAAHQPARREHPMSTRTAARVGIAAAVLTLVPAHVATADGTHGDHGHGRDVPRLVGRAVLPVETYAPGPPSGAGTLPPGQTEAVVNGIHFPHAVAARRRVLGGRSTAAVRVSCWRCRTTVSGQGQLRGLPDPRLHDQPRLQDDSAAASGAVAVGDFIQFARPEPPDRVPDRPRGTTERWLTGGDIDPESLQRDRRRRPLGRRRVRPVDPALRRRRPAPGGADQPARRADVAEQPAPRRHADTSPTAAASRRWR